MSVINLDRDMYHVSQSMSAVVSDPAAMSTSSLQLRSDGLVASVVKSLFTNTNVNYNLAANQYRSLALHLTGPDATGGAPYRVRANVTLYSDTGINLDPMLILFGLAVPAATITSASVGNASRQHIFLDSCRGGNLFFNDIVYCPTFESLYPGLGYEEAPIAFFLLYLWKSATSTIDLKVQASMSAQRLSVAPPVYPKVVP